MQHNTEKIRLVVNLVFAFNMVDDFFEQPEVFILYFLFCYDTVKWQNE